MSQESSNPTSPSRPVPASEQQETITAVSHVFSLSEVSASLEALNIEVERKPNVVHRAQTSYSPGVSQSRWSLNTWDNQRSTPVSPQKPKRYCKVPFFNYANCSLLVFSFSYAGSHLHLLSEGCACFGECL